MPRTLELLGRGPITIESAIDEEKNVINWFEHSQATEKLYNDVWERRRSIEALVRHHLGLRGYSTCVVQPRDSWLRGTFNLCVLVEVHTRRTREKIIFRCPMPHKLAETKYPGSVDEKLRCEVATSIWVGEHCPEIRPPHLFGFGLPGHRHFTHTDHLPFYYRIFRHLQRFVNGFFRTSLLSYYMSTTPPNDGFDMAYSVVEYLGPESGKVLSDTFSEHRHDKVRRQTLFQGMARIMCSLASFPQPRIGAFRFHDDGTISLTNRPLTCSMMILENDGARRTMQTNDTFNCTDAYVSDMLTLHDHRFLSEPNAVYSEGDCRGQMAVKTLLRVMSHEYVKRDLRSGPFVLQLTDLHASSIMVDDDWNVTGLIDLEWMCALPAEMLEVPYWLTDCAVDELRGDKLAEFERVWKEFMRVFREEEPITSAATATREGTLSSVIQEMWDTRGLWFWHCLSSVNAMYFLLESHLYPPQSLSVETETCLSKFWRRNSEQVVQAKLADKSAYDAKLRKLFDQ